MPILGGLLSVLLALSATATATASAAVTSAAAATSGRAATAAPAQSAAAAPKWYATELPLPADGGGSEGYLYGKTHGAPACAASSCVIVGTYHGSSGYEGLIASGSGRSWKAMAAPLPAAAKPAAAEDAEDTNLEDVACGSQCVAIGSYVVNPDSIDQTYDGLLEVGSGSSWTPLSAPVPAKSDSSSLEYAACGTICAVVGDYSPPSGVGGGGLLELGSGKSWKASTVPLPANSEGKSGGVTFSGVTCKAKTCLAYGSYYTKTGVQEGLLLSETNGGRWGAAEVPLPANASKVAPVVELWAACQSAKACTVVGNYEDNGDNPHGLLLSGIGRGWKSSASRLASIGGGLVLDGVACPSGTSCTFTGGDGVYDAVMVTVAAGKWTVVKEPFPKNSHGATYQTGFGCTTKGVCTATGMYSTASAQEGYLVTGSGKTWKAAEAPVPGNAESDPDVTLNQVACNATVCAVEGWYYTSHSGSLGSTPYLVSD